MTYENIDIQKINNPPDVIEGRIINIENQELQENEKENLIDAWLKIAVDNQQKPADFKEWNNEKIKDWLYSSLMTDVFSLSKEWGLNVDEQLIQEIQNEKNPEKKSTLELKYIENINNQVSGFLKDKDRMMLDSKWASWPSHMRRGEQFNCVGAALLGNKFFEQVGLEFYNGHPPSHVLNIAKLSNGEWVYVDLSNNKVKKIQPKELMLSETKVLEINESDIVYHYIPLFKSNTISSSILKNFEQFKKEIKENVKLDQKQLSDFLTLSEEFKDVDFLNFAVRLYPERFGLEDSKEFQKEAQRVSEVFDVIDKINIYTLDFTLEQRLIIGREFKNNGEIVKEFLYNENDKILKKFENMTPEAEKTLKFAFNLLKNIHSKQSFSYIVDLIIHPSAH